MSLFRCWLITGHDPFSAFYERFDLAGGLRRRNFEYCNWPRLVDGLHLIDHSLPWNTEATGKALSKAGRVPGCREGLYYLGGGKGGSEILLNFSS